MDIFAEHGIAGIVGLLFNALFGAAYIIGLDGVNTGKINGGWLNSNFSQLYVQIAYILAAAGWSFVVSAILASLINLIPGLHLRASEEAELLGMDDDQLGEFAYDYVEVRRDYLAWTPANNQPSDNDQDADVPRKNRHGIQQMGEMLEGREPSQQGSEETKNGEEGGGSSSEGEKHTGIGGDRHAMLAEKKKGGD